MQNNRKKTKRLKDGYFPKYTDRNGPYLEYHMPAAQAKDILAARQGEDKKVDPQDYLCDYMNLEGGLLGFVTRVVIV